MVVANATTDADRSGFVLGVSGTVWPVTEQYATSPTPPRVDREVVSFVRRSARMRPTHQQAWERLRHRYVIDVPRRTTSTSISSGQSFDLVGVFGRRAPLVVEIGPGTGESLVAMASARPDVDILAFEVYLPGLARLVRRLDAEQVGNVRLVQGDAVDGLRNLLPADALVDETWTFFPDPWPKTRHHKRRLVTAAFADLVSSRLASGGVWRLATDWQDYADQMRTVLDVHPELENLGGADRWSKRYPARPITRFEQRGIEAGRTVRDLTYRRR